MCTNPHGSGNHHLQITRSAHPAARNRRKVHAIPAKQPVSNCQRDKVIADKFAWTFYITLVNAVPGSSGQTQPDDEVTILQDKDHSKREHQYRYALVQADCGHGLASVEKSDRDEIQKIDPARHLRDGCGSRRQE